MKCRLCHSTNLQLFIDLGLIPIVDKFISKKDLNQPEIFYPLNVNLCKDCGLAQLGYIVPAEKLFNENYPYDSRMTRTRKDSYHQLATYICKKFKLPKNSFIIDIGSNTGLLLDSFKKMGMQVLGVEASSNVAKIANSSGIETMVGFFDSGVVEEIISRKQRAQIVTATNVFAHIQDYDSFAKALKKLLSDDGIFVIQVPHFLQLLKNLEYDTIYHEHVSYFGLKPLIQFFTRFDMEIFDVIEEPIDGGSIRCFVSKKGQKSISSNVNKILKSEQEAQIYSIDRLQKFAADVKKQKKELMNLLLDLKHKNKRIVGVSASAKGITLLSYCKINGDILSYITEKDKLKIGKFVAGLRIPVESDEVLLHDKPDYALLLAWNFSEEIMKNLEDYRKGGGKFIIPIPNPRVV